MGYNKITTMNISVIKRRNDKGEKISSITKSLDYDGKTIRKYLNVIEEHQGSRGSRMFSK